MRLSRVCLLAAIVLVTWDGVLPLRRRCQRVRVRKGRMRMYNRGKSAEFTCWSNFTLIGSRYARCRRGNVWSHQPPLCIHPGCPALDSLPGLKVTSRYKRAMLKFECPPWTNMTGPATLTCDGVDWSDQPPTCIGTTTVTTTTSTTTSTTTTTTTTSCVTTTPPFVSSTSAVPSSGTPFQVVTYTFSDEPDNTINTSVTFETDEESGTLPPEVMTSQNMDTNKNEFEKSTLFTEAKLDFSVTRQPNITDNDSTYMEDSFLPKIQTTVALPKRNEATTITSEEIHSLEPDVRTSTLPPTHLERETAASGLPSGSVQFQKGVSRRAVSGDSDEMYQAMIIGLPTGVILAMILISVIAVLHEVRRAKKLQEDCYEFENIGSNECPA